jgi:hypothetical protein
MDTHHHIDEISVWYWVAALVFVMLALTAAFVATHDNVRLARETTAPALPFAEPALVSPPTIADPRA